MVPESTIIRGGLRDNSVMSDRTNDLPKKYSCSSYDALKMESLFDLVQLFFFISTSLGVFTLLGLEIRNMDGTVLFHLITQKRKKKVKPTKRDRISE
jgi:hypothetical protein